MGDAGPVELDQNLGAAAARYLSAGRSGAEMTTVEHPPQDAPWHTLAPQDAAERMGVDPEQGLATDEVQRRLAQYGPNELPSEPPPSMWVVARAQLANPMNIMLLIVCAASFAILQVATGVVVLGLVTFNVVMGTAQELKARASVEALAQLQVPHARVRRSGRVEEVESTRLVPGDVVLLEAGDVVPADGRRRWDGRADGQAHQDQHRQAVPGAGA
jgi:Ca2+-transporting ATPase